MDGGNYGNRKSEAKDEQKYYYVAESVALARHKSPMLEEIHTQASITLTVRAHIRRDD